MTPDQDSLPGKLVEEKIVHNKLPDQTTSEEKETLKKLFSLTADVDIDQEAAWNNIYSKISIPPASRSNRSYALAVAASIILLIVSGIIIYNYSGSTVQELVYETAAQQKTISLPDGSSVILNNDSKLIVSKNFGVKSRNVKLIGEGLFSVKKSNENQRFTVSTDQGKVTVLGTIFNVNTKNSTKVYVQKGLVSIANISGEDKLQLTKGELGTLKSTGSVSKINGNDNTLYWKTNKLSFRSKTIKEIVDTVTEQLNANIIVDKGIENCGLTLHFEGRDVEQFILALQKVKDIKVTKEGNNYVLSGDNC